MSPHRRATLSLPWDPTFSSVSCPVHIQYLAHGGRSVHACPKKPLRNELSEAMSQTQRMQIPVLVLEASGHWSPASLSWVLWTVYSERPEDFQRCQARRDARNTCLFAPSVSTSPFLATSRTYLKSLTIPRGLPQPTLGKYTAATACLSLAALMCIFFRAQAITYSYFDIVHPFTAW